MRHHLRAFTAAVVMSGWAGAAWAQVTLDKQRPDIVQDIVDGRSFNAENFVDYIALLAGRNGPLIALVQAHEESRADEQIGATSSAGGTTTMVSKGTVPKILGFAVENGAVSRSQSDTTVTFRTNLGGSIQALAGRGFIEILSDSDPALSVLRRVSLSASFDTSRGASETESAVLRADRQQLSQWTARAELVNRRDPQGSRGLSRWSAQVAPALAGVGRDTAALYDAVVADPAILAWLGATSAELQALPARTASAVDTVLRAREASFPAVDQLQQGTRNALTAYELSVVAFTSQRDSMLEGLAGGPLLSVEYVEDRPLSGPKLLTTRVVGAVGSAIQLTGNLGFTLYSEKPDDNTGRFRDYQAAAQLDISVGRPHDLGVYVLSFSGKYIKQLENSVDAAGVVLPDTTGSTKMAQIKLTIPMKGAGVKIPLSVTFANRTDLIKESVVRANVGFTFDLDSTFARFKP
jgi:hypothetical protein